MTKLSREERARIASELLSSPEEIDEAVVAAVVVTFISGFTIGARYLSASGLLLRAAVVASIRADLQADK